MKNILAFISILFLSIQIAFADKQNDVPIILNETLILNVDVYWSGDAWLDSFYVTKQNFHFKDGILVKSYQSIWRDKELQQENEPKEDQFFWRSVKNMVIKIQDVGRTSQCPSKKLALNQLSVFDYTNLGYIQDFELDFRDFGCELEINFEEFKSYPNWIRLNTMKSFVIKGVYKTDFQIESIFPFTNLENLEVPFYLGSELTNFPNLRRLSCYGATSGVLQQTTQLKHLTQVDEPLGPYLNQFERCHAQRFFNLLVQLQPKKETGSLFYQTEFHNLILRVQADLPKLWKDKGMIFINEHDLIDYAPETADGDTLLYGKVRRGKPRGVWTFKLKSQYERNDEETHHINFSKSNKLKIPKNGTWKLDYTNGFTAIEGNFENNLKVGEWRFNKENGELKTQHFYNNDTLIRSITQIEVSGVPCESRTYYLSETACLQSFSNGESVYFTYTDWDNEIDPVSYSSGGITVKNGATGFSQTFKKGTPEFEKNFNEWFRQTLYPELVGKEFPYNY